MSNTITGGVIWTLKNFRMLVVSYSLDNTLGYGGSIDVYMRNKTYGTWTLLQSITDDTVNFAKIYENKIDGNMNIWNECEFKLVLNADVTKAYSPIVYEATFIYEDNLKA